MRVGNLGLSSFSVSVSFVLGVEAPTMFVSWKGMLVQFLVFMVLFGYILFQVPPGWLSLLVCSSQYLIRS